MNVFHRAATPITTATRTKTKKIKSARSNWVDNGDATGRVAMKKVDGRKMAKAEQQTSELNGSSTMIHKVEEEQKEKKIKTMAVMYPRRR